MLGNRGNSRGRNGLPPAGSGFRPYRVRSGNRHGEVVGGERVTLLGDTGIESKSGL